MNFLIVIIIIIGGLLFIYLNVKLICKINLTAYFTNFYLDIILFRKNITIVKKVDYYVIIKKIVYRKNNKDTFDLFKHYLHYLKYSKYPLKIFIIKNILFYEECFEDKFSIALEFYIVNKIIKRSLLNG